MISDVLADAVRRIDFYLHESKAQYLYQGSLRTRVYLVRNAMEDMCAELDEVPDVVEDK